MPAIMAKSLGATVLCSAVSLASASAPASAPAAAPAADWYPYSDANWVSLDVPTNMVCRDGLEQSPVDFTPCPNPIMRPPIMLNWTTQAVKLENNAHTVVLKVPNSTIAGGMYVDIEGSNKAYNLVQCHFHFGAEHTVGGKQFPFEAHCVHEFVSSSEGAHYGVAGFFFEAGNTADPFLALFEDDLPSHSASASKRRLDEASFSYNVWGEPLNSDTKRRLATEATESSYVGPTDFSLLYSGVNMQKYYNYRGSFTTPPCTEAVDFYIFMQHKIMTNQQLEKFKDAMGWKIAGGNFRPPQPLNDRTVWGCTANPPVRMNNDWYPYSADNWATSVGANSKMVCKSGAMQSPIDFASCATTMDREAIGITWKDPQPVDILNNGHTIVLSMKSAAADTGKMTAAGKTYSLLQCHFHWASEHTVAGRPYPFETHCVHQLDTNNEAVYYGVFGLFYTIGSADSFLGHFEDNLPSAAAHRRLAESAGLNVFGEPMGSDGQRILASAGGGSSPGDAPMRSLYGSNRRTRYWSYSGSFTTPPCTEAVDFFIMMNPSSLSLAQLEKYKDAIGWESAGGNFRPPQKLGARIVTGCSTVMNLRQQTDNAISKGFDESLDMLIGSTVSENMRKILTEEQQNHYNMMVTLLVLAIVVHVLLIAAVGLVALLLKSA